MLRRHLAASCRRSRAALARVSGAEAALGGVTPAAPLVTPAALAPRRLGCPCSASTAGLRTAANAWRQLASPLLPARPQFAPRRALTALASESDRSCGGAAALVDGQPVGGAAAGGGQPGPPLQLRQELAALFRELKDAVPVAVDEAAAVKVAAREGAYLAGGEYGKLHLLVRTWRRRLKAGLRGPAADGLVRGMSGETIAALGRIGSDAEEAGYVWPQKIRAWARKMEAQSEVAHPQEPKCWQILMVLISASFSAGLRPGQQAQAVLFVRAVREGLGAGPDAGGGAIPAQQAAVEAAAREAKAMAEAQLAAETGAEAEAGARAGVEVPSDSRTSPANSAMLRTLAAIDAELRGSQAGLEEAKTHVLAQVRRGCPGCVVECFGSQAVGLALPGADLDVQVLPDPEAQGPGQGAISSVAKVLRRAPFMRLDTFCVIRRARTPLIKFEYSTKQYKVPVDVAFPATDRSSTVRDWTRAKMAEQPLLRPMVLLLKALLLQHGLSSPASGGLGGYSLINMTLLYLEHHAPPCGEGEAGDAPDLHRHVAGFLELFGRRFDYARHEIALSEPGGMVAIKGGPSKAKRSSEGPPACRLIIRDPCDPSNNVASPTFNMAAVRALFATSCERLERSGEQGRQSGLLKTSKGGLPVLRDLQAQPHEQPPAHEGGADGTGKKRLRGGRLRRAAAGKGTATKGRKKGAPRS
eukprot:jgi/Tetstr1/456246/TSEL_043007.t1